jgi:hypothetical protein
LKVHLITSDLKENVQQQMHTFTKRALVISRRCRLLKVKLTQTQVTINAQNARKNQSAEILQKREVLYVSKACAIIIERQKVEKLRRQACKKRTEKKTIAKLKKIHKQTKQ